jgi:outer membrane protein assembly factor BamA
MSRLPVLSLLCFLSTLVSPAFGQYTAGRITFTGTEASQQSALEAASGLHTGQHFTAEELQAAAQHLIDTGNFDDVQVALEGPFKSIAVKFSVKPAAPSRLLKVSFANLIWWQPGELQPSLQARLPLFNGTLPEAGNQQQAAQDTLQQLLSQKGVTATLAASVIEPISNQRQRLIEFRVTSPEITLHNATFSGVSSTFSPEIDKLIAAAIGAPYNEGLTNKALTERVLNLYRDAGYLDASFSKLERTPQPLSAGKTPVDLTVTVNQG